LGPGADLAATHLDEGKVVNENSGCRGHIVLDGEVVVVGCSPHVGRGFGGANAESLSARAGVAGVEVPTIELFVVRS